MIWVNGFPVVVTPKLVFSFNTSGKIAANFSFTGYSKINGKSSIKYENGSWSPVYESNKDAGGNLNFFAEGSAEADLSGRLDFQFYNLKNVTLSAAAGVEAQASATLDLIKGELECKIEVGPKAYMEAALKAFGFSAKATVSIPFEPFFERENVCKRCNIQIVDSSANQATTSGILELKYKVTTLCGNLPLKNHPMNWSYTVDGEETTVQTFTDDKGFAKLDWQVPTERTRRKFVQIYVCAENGPCRTTIIDETTVVLSIYLSQLNYDCDGEGGNQASITGNFGFTIDDLRYTTPFDGSSTQGLVLNQQIPVYYSIGNTDLFPKETTKLGNIFYDYQLSTDAGFHGLISFHLTQVGNTVIRKIELDGKNREEERDGKLIEYSSGGGGVTVTIRQENNPTSPCWPSLTGKNTAAIKTEVREGSTNAVLTNEVSSRYRNDSHPNQSNLAYQQSSIVKVYPNPAINEVNIIFQKPSTQTTVLNLYDIFGNLVVKNILDAPTKNATLDISSLPNGAYFLKIRSRENYATKKFLVNRK